MDILLLPPQKQRLLGELIGLARAPKETTICCEAKPAQSFVML